MVNLTLGDRDQVALGAFYRKQLLGKLFELFGAVRVGERVFIIGCLVK